MVLQPGPTQTGVAVKPQKKEKLELNWSYEVEGLNYYLEQKKTPNAFLHAFQQSALFSDIARYMYVYFVTYIRLTDAPIRFWFQPITEELAQLDWMHEIISNTQSAHAQADFFFTCRSTSGYNQQTDTLWLWSNFNDDFKKKQIKLSSTQKLSPLQLKVFIVSM